MMFDLQEVDNMKYLLTEVEMMNLKDPVELVVETIVKDNYLFLFVVVLDNNLFLVVVVVVVVLDNNSFLVVVVVMVVDNNLLELAVDNAHLYPLENSGKRKKDCLDLIYCINTFKSIVIIRCSWI
jgi:hypothetical protein